MHSETFIRTERFNVDRFLELHLIQATKNIFDGQHK